MRLHSYVAYYISLALRCTIIYVNVNMLRIDDEKLPIHQFPRISKNVTGIGLDYKSIYHARNSARLILQFT